MLYIKQEDVSQILTMQACIDVMKETFSQLARGKVLQPLRTAHKLSDGNILGLMPAYSQASGILGSKIITVFPKNHSKGLPSHQGVVLLFDADNGSLQAIVDGGAITAIRTAAVSAVATDLLAKKNASNLAIIGAGTQAKTHLEAMLLVRDIKKVAVWDYYDEAAKKFASQMAKRYQLEIEPCATVEQAVQNADLICTVSLATEPILRGEWLQSGTHINAVGACAPKHREIDTQTIVRGKLYVDKVESTINEAGCYLIPLAEGAINKEHIVGEVGQLLIGDIKGRESDTEITVFKALGLAVEDIAAADYIFQRAAKLKKGIAI